MRKILVFLPIRKTLNCIIPWVETIMNPRFFIDDEFQFSSMMKYSGIAQNAYGQEGDEDHIKYTIETTTGQVIKRVTII